MAIDNVSTIDDRRSKFVRNRVFFYCHLSPNLQQMAIENTVSSDFDPLSSNVKSVFDCQLSDVVKLRETMQNQI